MKINVSFLTENTDHEINVDPDITVLRFKEILQHQIPFLRQFSSIPTEVLKLSMEGFDGGLTGSAMEDGRKIGFYPLTEERQRVLLALERSVEKIFCQKCTQPFVEWSSRLTRDVSGTEDQENRKKKKAASPRLLNCGHSVCLECLTEVLVAAEEVLAEETALVLLDPELISEEAAKEQNQEATKRATENARREKERAKAENMWKIACPLSCGVLSYWRRDQEWQAHEGIQKLMHLKKREWIEAENARGRCFIKNCGAEALFLCSDCKETKYCAMHYQRYHQYEDTADHQSVFLLSKQFSSSCNAMKTRYCCYCGGGAAATCGESVDRSHCEHKHLCAKSIFKDEKLLKTAIFKQNLPFLSQSYHF